MEALSERHFDELSNVINNATNLALQGLSEVIGRSIQSLVLKIELIEIKNVVPKTLSLKDKNFGVLTQTFTGLADAELILLFAQKSVQRIVQNMLGEDVNSETVEECEADAMSELGNIMMNAYLSSLADTFHTPIDSAVPNYTNKTQDDVAQYIKNDSQTKFILVSHLDFAIDNHSTEGKIFLLISPATLENIANEIEKLTAM